MLQTAQPYISIFLLTTLGVFGHMLLAMKKINDTTPGIDFKGVWKKYFQTEFISLLLSGLFVIAWTSLANELFDLKNPTPIDYKTGVAQRLLNFAMGIKFMSFSLGLCADYVIYIWAGRTKKALDKEMGNDDKP